MAHVMPPEIMQQIQQEQWAEPQIKAAVSALRLRLVIARDYGLMTPDDAAAAMANADRIGQAAIQDIHNGGGGGMFLSRLFEDAKINEISDRVTKALYETTKEMGD